MYYRTQNNYQLRFGSKGYCVIYAIGQQVFYSFGPDSEFVVGVNNSVTRSSNYKIRFLAWDRP